MDNVKNYSADDLHKETTKPSPRLNFSLSTSLNQELNLRLAQDGYIAKRKSEWIAEAIMGFIESCTSALPSTPEDDFWQATVFYTGGFKLPSERMQLKFNDKARIYIQRITLLAQLWGLDKHQQPIDDLNYTGIITTAILWRFKQPVGWLPERSLLD